jgi:hypothetical protein
LPSADRSHAGPACLATICPPNGLCLTSGFVSPAAAVAVPICKRLPDRSRADVWTNNPAFGLCKRLPDRSRADVWTNNPAFGLNALGGAISFQMKDGFTYSGTEFDASGGSYGRVGGSIQYGVRNGEWALYLAAQLTADFNDDSILELPPDLLGPSTTQNSGIIGETADVGLKSVVLFIFHLRVQLAIHFAGEEYLRQHERTLWRSPAANLSLHSGSRQKRCSMQDFPCSSLRIWALDSLNSSSISKRPRQLASKYHRRCSPAPIPPAFIGEGK